VNEEKKKQKSLYTGMPSCLSFVFTKSSITPIHYMEIFL